MKQQNDDMIKEIEKRIRLVFPDISQGSWDSIVLDHNNELEKQYIDLIRSLVIEDKDKLLFDVVSETFLRKKVFYDYDGKFNDTLNRLKKSTYEILEILNKK